MPLGVEYPLTKPLTAFVILGTLVVGTYVPHVHLATTNHLLETLFGLASENGGLLLENIPARVQLHLKLSVATNSLISNQAAKLKQITDHPVFDERAPAWSPDSKQLGFLSDRDGNPRIFAIHIMNADGSNQHAITKNNLDPTRLSWSPDGQVIAFAVTYASEGIDHRNPVAVVFVIDRISH